MKKLLKKMVTMGLTAAMAVSAMSIGAFADENDAVYTLIGEDGNEIVYTQADLDAGHWNVDALGKESPYVYEEFPMNVGKFVNDYGELQLELRYMKTVDEGDSAAVTLTEMDTEEDVFTTQNLDGVIYTDALKMNTDYLLTLSETFDGETTEYMQVVSTYYAEAEMPEYVTSAVYDSDCTILVGDVEDLRNSEKVDENGDTYIDSDMKRYDKVSATDFNAYRMNLPANAVYKIFTRDENDNRYTGFISTYENSGTPLIYMPDINVYSWETYNTPQTYSDPGLTITASMVKNAEKTDMSMFRDHTVLVRNSYSPYDVYSFDMPGNADVDNTKFSWQMHFDNYATVETWALYENSTTPVKYATYTKVKDKNLEMYMSAFGNNPRNIVTGYIVIYFPNISVGRGTICIQPDDGAYYPSDDVTGSSYEAYHDTSSLTSMPLTEHTLYDGRDVDCFFINYKSSTTQKYGARLNNICTKACSGTRSHTSKVMEIAHYINQTAYFYTTAVPDDIITALPGTQPYITFSVSLDQQKFIYVYNSDSNVTYSNEYKLFYNKKK